MLRRNDNRVYPFGLFVVAVLDRHLAFRVGTQVGHLFAFAPDDGQFFEDDLCEDQRGGHELFGLGAGITEHDTLVSRSLLLFGLAHDALVDVGRLFVDRREDAA